MVMFTYYNVNTTDNPLLLGYFEKKLQKQLRDFGIILFDAETILSEKNGIKLLLDNKKYSTVELNELMLLMFSIMLLCTSCLYTSSLL